jgi:hypothetical protein
MSPISPAWSSMTSRMIQRSARSFDGQTNPYLPQWHYEQLRAHRSQGRSAPASPWRSRPVAFLDAKSALCSRSTGNTGLTWATVNEITTFQCEGEDLYAVSHVPALSQCELFRAKETANGARVPEGQSREEKAQSGEA